MNLVLFYDSINGNVEADANGPRTGAIYDDHALGTGKVFRQARIAAQFGNSPWSANRYRAPARAEHLITFGIPPGPAIAAEFGLANNQGACADSWLPHHRVAMTHRGTSGHRQAVASGAWRYGCDFNVTLEP